MMKLLEYRGESHTTSTVYLLNNSAKTEERETGKLNSPPMYIHIQILKMRFFKNLSSEYSKDLTHKKRTA